ncbi:putative insecticidal toxin complex protein [Fusarium austroafricanum]|uniref:Putative insecticidal toxin complex protein n=1 Tax=Fusarium austroafricanum TaxID=2364996 RepID=A0A8H4JTE5_9HYPO|nr:putative insecticidal toxin complex protein [Fusarium austroafricanum]
MPSVFRQGTSKGPPSGQTNSTRTPAINNKNVATAFGSRASSSFSPRARTLGEGIPVFRTSFNVSGKGGGAFKPISENFSVSPASGTLSFSLPIQTSPSRGDYGPDLKLTYDSGSGNGPFGFGWNVSLPSIHRKTSRAVPRYVEDEDDMAMSGADIVKRLTKDGSVETRVETGDGNFDVTLYRPRIDTGSMRIERWVRRTDPVDVHWRTLSSDNETSIYGDSDDSRILDASGATITIFSWLLSRSYDARGNAIEYIYKREDGKEMDGPNGSMPVCERDRPKEAKCRQKYIKRIKYGNRELNRDVDTWNPSKWPSNWMFEVVFDYGEHKKDNPSTEEPNDWLLRQDAFSQSHAGFEVRTYRLCRRILMFHHFPEHTKRDENLVSSTSLLYSESPQRTVMTNVTMSGHSIRKDSPADTAYWSEALPAWSFEYTGIPDITELESIQAKTFNLLALPNSESKVSEWLDLDSEGMPGLLTRSNDGTLCYQRNLGLASAEDEPQFRGPVVLAQHPSLTGGTFQDLDQNGHLNYVLKNYQGRLQGFFERGDSDTWSTYSDFPQTPSAEVWKDTIEIDLTGDGLADLLCAGDDAQALIWQQNLGKQGLSGYRSVFSREESSLRPRLSKTQDVQTYVADMTGSGMSDLVEISASSVRYWPNFGYGVFGPPVSMENSPALSAREEFDHGRVRLIDMDGSGTTDLLYILPTGGAALYYNFAGNSWSNRVFIPQLPLISNPSSVFTLDILGKGTSCLCWTDASTDRNRINYIDTMGGTKPHLLKTYSNGLGASTSIEYSPSTKFYVEDERSGLPWSTKLPFPVQCVSTVQVKDFITGNQNSTEYIYHNGCFDPVEKQFAGFEMVEELHREKIIMGKNEIYEPPIIHKKSWFSVGMSLEVDQSRFFTKQLVSSCLEDHTDDFAERLFSLKGVSLRSETYSNDGTDAAGLPFIIEELSYQVKLLQSKGTNKYSVVQVSPRETLSKQFERRMQDPRVTHDITLETNDFGEVEESVRIVYPRTGETEFSDVAKNQKAGNVTHNRTWFTESVSEDRDFRKPEAWKKRECEVINFPFNGTLDFDDARRYDFEGLPLTKATSAYKVLRRENRAFYKDSHLEQRLGEGKLQAHSLLDQTYDLALDPELVGKIQEGLCSRKVPDSVEELLVQGSYVKLDNSGGWWVPSSRSFFCKPGSVAGEELRKARSSFYIPSFFVDAFGNMSRLTMDQDFLLAKEIEDAVGNVSSFKNSYEHLQPVKITDPNLNSVQAVLDPLSRTIAVAVLGKGEADEVDADSVDGVALEIGPQEGSEILLDPTGETAKRALGNAGSRTIYCIDRFAQWKAEQDGQRSSEHGKSTQRRPTDDTPTPGYSLHITRALPFRKVNDPEIQVKISYINGRGAQLQEVSMNDPNDLEKTWLVAGLSISDNQGQGICVYQPFFSPSPKYISSEAIKTHSAITFHDAMGRTVASLTADKRWSKTVYTPWTMTDYNNGDLILNSKLQDDPNVGHFFERISSARYEQSWYEQHSLGAPQEKKAAEKSAIYADKPLITHIGSCGLPIRAVRVAGVDMYSRALSYDVNGNKIRDFDSYSRLVEKAVYDKLGNKLRSIGMDKGDSWSIKDVQGGELLSWNCRGYSFATRYDDLRREIQRLVWKGSETAKLIKRVTYGEKHGDAATLNLKNQVWTVEDQAGVHVNTLYDIGGHCLEKTFQPAQEYKKVIDWKFNNTLEDAIYLQTSAYDNYGHIIENKDAQGNRTRSRFSLQGHVEKVEFSSTRDSTWKPYLSHATFMADGLPSSMKGGREVLEDITHVYDCNGRRVFTRDDSEQTKYFKGSRVKPEWDYTYDVNGMLISATGRAQFTSSRDGGNQLSPHSAMSGQKTSRGATDGNQLYQYLETYDYDLEGNIKWMKHDAPNVKGVTGWTRHYFYEEQSLLSSDPDVKSNRLSRTTIGENHEGTYSYDGDAGLAGCMTTLPKFSELDWDMNNMLAFSSTQNVYDGIPERTYYVYDSAGTRTRKVTESSAKTSDEPSRKTDVLYIGGIELQTRRDGSELWIATVKAETTLAVVEVSSNRQKPLVRFQTGDNMELDDEAQLVTYEEYSPFGSVVYSAMYSNVEAPRKYRFAKYEHDQETGLYHCGRRYYCPWLVRWTSPDPLGDVDGPNLYEYSKNDPINIHGPNGTSILKRKIAGKLAQQANTPHVDPLTQANQETHAAPTISSLVSKMLHDSQVVKDKIISVFRARFDGKKGLGDKHDEMMKSGWKPAAQQHHLFRDKWAHLFRAAKLDNDAATLFCETEVHNKIGPYHDKGWDKFWVDQFKAGYPNMTKYADKLIIAELKNPESVITQRFALDIRKYHGVFEERIYNQVADNLWNSGIDPELVKDSISFYKVEGQHKGKILDMEGYEALREKYTQDQLESQEIYRDEVASRQMSFEN